MFSLDNASNSFWLKNVPILSKSRSGTVKSSAFIDFISLKLVHSHLSGGDIRVHGIHEQFLRHSRLLRVDEILPSQSVSSRRALVVIRRRLLLVFAQKKKKKKKTSIISHRALFLDTPFLLGGVLLLLLLLLRDAAAEEEKEEGGEGKQEQQQFIIRARLGFRPSVRLCPSVSVCVCVFSFSLKQKVLSFSFFFFLRGDTHKKQDNPPTHHRLRVIIA